MSQKAFLLVDVQNDFCAGGALAVPRGDEVIPVLNRYLEYFQKQKYPIFASRDWHPRRTKHFKEFGGLWPVHCVSKTYGAKFHSQLKLPKSAIILSKGMHPSKDSYSAFQAQDKNKNPFYKILKKMKINSLFIGGLATDYCVKSSVLDALKKDFKVHVLKDAVKGVNLKKSDSQMAIREMKKKGAKFNSFKDLTVDFQSK